MTPVTVGSLAHIDIRRLESLMSIPDKKEEFHHD